MKHYLPLGNAAQIAKLQKFEKQNNIILYNSATFLTLTKPKIIFKG